MNGFEVADKGDVGVELVDIVSVESTVVAVNTNGPVDVAPELPLEFESTVEVDELADEGGGVVVGVTDA